METVESLTQEIAQAIDAYNATLTPITTSRLDLGLETYNRNRQATANAKANLDALENKRFRLYRETTELRNTQIFQAANGELLDVDGNPLGQGWYYWYCVPGCLPDSEPFGPYESYAKAELAAYSEQYDQDLQALV